MHNNITIFLFFLMIRRPPRSTLSSSSAASDVYKRQDVDKDILAAVIRLNEAITLCGVEPLNRTGRHQRFSQAQQARSGRKISPMHGDRVLWAVRRKMMIWLQKTI
eukprot:TRINITY_DN44026_c0_g1_i1.p1 TRINITY_DN44026_c0_g1~~TRINITY_DN44026_c0_g1_i1.p1  ORF type:complete len:106 (+),score=22.27 TRINITY_DN44026_c0_g1_i1:39-356(+)